MSAGTGNADHRKPSAEFVTTHWTTILHAARTGSPEKLRALERLCRAYWYPIFVFVRRKGHSEHDAQDLTQMFFTHILTKESLKNVDQTKGRFRSFLLASVKNFLSNEWDKKRAEKRGKNSTLSFGDCSPDELYRHEPVDKYTPERLFERRWAFILIDRVMLKLQADYASGERSKIYEQLHPLLTIEAGATALAEPARILGLNEGALRVAVHRMRRRFGELLREEISQTVSSPGEVDAEIRNLMSVIAE